MASCRNIWGRFIRCRPDAKLGTALNLFRSTFHRDGSVTVWDVYDQRWRRFRRRLPDEISASLDKLERGRIERHFERHASI